MRYKLILTCLCLLLSLSVSPVSTDAETNDHVDTVITNHQDSDTPEDTDDAENTDIPEVPDQSVTPSEPGKPEGPVIPSVEYHDDIYLVSYTANTVSRGGFTTPIWKQHSIWSKQSSASRHGCGICVASMALQLNGVHSSPNRILRQTNRSIKNCQSLKPRQAVKVLRKNHVAGKLVNTKAFTRKQCVNIMKNSLDKGKVVMSLVRGKPFSNGTHWVLIVGYDKKGRVVVANSSYGNRGTCVRTKKQYHLVNWKQIQKKIIRDSVNYSAFIIVG